LNLRRELTLALAAAGPLPDRCRRPLLRSLGMQIAPDCGIRAGLRVNGGVNVALESGVFLNHDVSLQADALISIGRNSQVGSGSHLITADHELGGPDRRVGTDTSAPIVIGEGCWIGVGVIILPGVTIGSGCLIAAGAVVTKDCAANTLYAGVPARAVRELPV